MIPNVSEEPKPSHLNRSFIRNNINKNISRLKILGIPNAMKMKTYNFSDVFISIIPPSIKANTKIKHMAYIWTHIYLGYTYAIGVVWKTCMISYKANINK